MDYFVADIARSQMFTSDVIKARNVHSSIRHVIYHSFSHGSAFYIMLNCLVRIENTMYVLCLINKVINKGSNLHNG